jgi:hypothetical protein
VPVSTTLFFSTKPVTPSITVSGTVPDRLVTTGSPAARQPLLLPEEGQSPHSISVRSQQVDLCDLVNERRRIALGKPFTVEVEDDFRARVVSANDRDVLGTMLQMDYVAILLLEIQGNLAAVGGKCPPELEIGEAPRNNFPYLRRRLNSMRSNQVAGNNRNCMPYSAASAAGSPGFVSLTP